MGLFKVRTSLFLAVFLGFLAVSRPGLSVVNYQHMMAPPQITGQNATFQWPSNNINLSQLEQILTQYQGMNQLNFQFPNQFNWMATPSSIQGLLGSIQKEAQSEGVTSPLSDLSLSSLADGGGLGLDQISIPNLLQGNINDKLDAVMRQLRYEELNLSNKLPDWLKDMIVSVYDAIYAVFDYIQTQIIPLVLPMFKS
jgi:hypothetical protein